MFEKQKNISKSFKSEIELNAQQDYVKQTIKQDNMIMDLLSQECYEKDGQFEMIDNRCISVYEEACDYLTEKGYLVKINDRMYKIIIWAKEEGI
jgi:hypothetical protein